MAFALLWSAVEVSLFVFLWCSRRFLNDIRSYSPSLAYHFGNLCFCAAKTSYFSEPPQSHDAKFLFTGGFLSSNSCVLLDVRYFHSRTPSRGTRSFRDWQRDATKDSTRLTVLQRFRDKAATRNPDAEKHEKVKGKYFWKYNDIYMTTNFDSAQGLLRQFLSYISN